MYIAGKHGILKDPIIIYAEENGDGEYDILAENEQHCLILYESIKGRDLQSKMFDIFTQIRIQGQ